MKNKRVKKGKQLRSTKFQIIKFQKEEMETHLQNNTKIFPRTKKHGFLKEPTNSPIQLMLTEPHTKKNIIKFQFSKDKGKILKSPRKTNKQNLYKGFTLKMGSELMQRVILEAGRQWRHGFKILRENNFQPRILSHEPFLRIHQTKEKPGRCEHHPPH